MRRRSSSRWEATPLACTLGLALLAAAAAPARPQTGAGTTPPAAPAPPAKSEAPASNARAGTESAAPAAASTAKTSAARASKTAAAKPAAPKTAAVKEPAAKKAEAGAKAPGADLSLRGGQEGTVFKSLTVEGEDRVHVDFERPELKINLELEQAPGLEWGSAVDVLNRSNSDLQTPLVALSAKQMTPYLGRPWLSEFATGPVARFHPEAEGVDRWKLVVVNSKGSPVKTFSGKGDPPREITWDGRAENGSPVTPGLTYSYVFEAYDRAGNKRNVVGQGFAVTAYRINSPEGPIMTFSATQLTNAAGANHAPAAPGGAETPTAPPILLEVASWLNQSEKPAQPIRVTATARSFEQADQLAGSVQRALAALVLGDPARISAVAVVEPDAPEAGTLTIAPGR